MSGDFLIAIYDFMLFITKNTEFFNILHLKLNYKSLFFLFL